MERGGPKVELEKCTLKEVRDRLPVEVAVLPWGSCEPHNLHLPYGCDTFTAAEVAAASTRKAVGLGARAIVLPAMPVGMNSNTLGFPLTLDWSTATQAAIVGDTVRALERHGILKLVILNGHGGNEFRGIVRDLHGRSPVRIFLLDWWKPRGDTAARVCENTAGEHANEAETSWQMHINPELVHLEWADEGAVRTPRLRAMAEGWVWAPRPWHLLTTNAGHGDPRRATAEKGRVILEETTAKIASFLVELSEARLDESFPY